MIKTSKANHSQLILTTKFKKEYLKTQASEKDAFFMLYHQGVYPGFYYYNTYHNRVWLKPLAIIYKKTG